MRLVNIRISRFDMKLLFFNKLLRQVMFVILLKFLFKQNSPVKLNIKRDIIMLLAERSLVKNQIYNLSIKFNKTNMENVHSPYLTTAVTPVKTKESSS